MSIKQDTKDFSPRIHGLRTVVGSRNRSRRPTRQYNVTSPESEYDFLVGEYVDTATMKWAKSLAEEWQVPLHDVLISCGWISQADYTRALSKYTEATCLHSLHVDDLDIPNVPEQIRRNYREGLFSGRETDEKGRTVVIASNASTKPAALKIMVQRMRKAGHNICLASAHQLRQAVTAVQGSVLTHDSIFGLEIMRPGCSARRGMNFWQKAICLLVLALFFFGAWQDTSLCIQLTGIVLSVLFLPVVILRIVTFYYAARWSYIPNAKKGESGAWWRPAAGLSNDSTLPVYTVLVPIFREKSVLLSLMQALMRLDYPSAKLDIKLIFEECDPETLNAAKTFSLPDHFEFVVVPDSQPRTKPKALNYAMQFARGDYVVIYDAEDQPAPDQLRKAVTAFRLAPESVACLQARLTFYNASENWLTKQFAIEYSALFNGILPTLQSLDIPIPLGGTSNHFRMSALRSTGAWDAFNVTEDADLGIRLYRAGYSCRVLNSVTFEEATCRIGSWIPQRTRWIKGWIQTYIVHMRQPVRLYRQLGAWGFMGFHVVIGGFLSSAFIHPLFLAYALWYLAPAFADGNLWQWPDDPMWRLFLFNLTFGYLSAMMLGGLAVWKSGMKQLCPHVLTMPFYWVLVSYSAYRALFQLFRNPFLWEKTQHGVSKIRPQLMKNG